MGADATGDIFPSLVADSEGASPEIAVVSLYRLEVLMGAIVPCAYENVPEGGRGILLRATAKGDEGFDELLILMTDWFASF
jgi:hypothetical protein